VYDGIISNEMKVESVENILQKAKENRLAAIVDSINQDTEII